MKVKTLLKTLSNVNYYLISSTGYELEEGYISEWDRVNKYTDYNTLYSDSEIVKIETLSNNDTLYITLK